MFAVVSVYIRPDKKRIVHCYGVFPTQREANNAKARNKRQANKDYEQLYKFLRERNAPNIDELSIHVCQVLDDEFFKQLNSTGGVE